jgi:hypothetical protein
MNRPRRAHCRKPPPIKKAPIDRAGEPRQRMADIDDLIERPPQQVLLQVVSRSRHPCLSLPKNPPPGKYDPPKNGIAKRKKAEAKPRVPGKSDDLVVPTYPLAAAKSAFFTVDYRGGHPCGP